MINQKNFDKRLFISTGLLMDWKLQTENTFFTEHLWTTASKKCPCQMFFSFFKIKVLLWHHYQLIHHHENYNMYIHVYSALLHHYCVSNILQRIKTVNKTWWYKQFFFKLCFRAKYNIKPKIYIVVIWLSSYSSFFYLLTFQCLSSVCSVLFFNVFYTHPHN